MDGNTLYYGDNLDILRRYVADESVDLVYLDPPFNSNADYNVLFAEKDGTQAHAQIKAFEDTWTWDDEAAREYDEVLRSGHDRVSKCLKGIHDFLRGSDMLAYLSMMALRLIELRRVLKPTGSIYLHCDPTASHYLKLVMDAVFGPENFRNEIIWRRTGSHNSKRTFGCIHDVILFYSRTNDYVFNVVRRPYMRGHVASRYTLTPDGRLKFTSGGNVLTGAKAVPEGDSGKPWRGFNPTSKNRHWAVPSFYEALMPPSYRSLSATEKLEALFQAGHIEIDGTSAWPIMVRYLDERDGVPLQDIWAAQPYTEGTVHGTRAIIDADVQWMGPTDPERLGYPTQKPDGLLERIIRASTNEGAVVLDPFCGCGTAVVAAQKLGRAWIGIDITHLAVNLIKVRLADSFGKVPYKVIGEPEDLEGARALADADKFQFQYWALGLVGARPVEQKKGADQGVDGRLYLTDRDGETRTVIIQVKGGHVGAAAVRDLRGVIEREGAAVGVLVTLEPPTAPMRKEAAEAGFFQTRTLARSKHPRLQILTVEELLAGKRIDLPLQQEVRSFKQAPKAKKGRAQDARLFE